MQPDRRIFRFSSLTAKLSLMLLALGAALWPAESRAQPVEELLTGVVQVTATVPADAQTAASLGREREGSGVVIDQAGLVVTIGYLVLEADEVTLTDSEGRAVPAQIVGYDYETGFGLLRALAPLKAKPLAFGNAAAVKERDPVVIASFGGMGGLAVVIARRTFAGPWEYLLDDAIFTAPPHPAWSGAALLDRDGKLVGIGSLILADATGNGQVPGNMFVPIDRLTPILGDLLAAGRAAGPAHPWLGLNTEALEGRLVVTRVSPGGPASRAGLRHGDLIEGVGGQPVSDLAEFYRKIRALGDAGVEVPLDVQQGGATHEIRVHSIDRRDYLRRDHTY